MRLALVLLLVMTGCGEKEESLSEAEVYLRKSKAVEARVKVKSLYRAAQFAYETESFDPESGVMRPPQIPSVAAGPTPPPGACCKQEGGKCIPDEALWTAPTWQALGFSVHDPHYYSYQYVPGADEGSFTVRAIGDLDCDGTYATFELTGRAEGGEIARPGDPVATNPLE